MEHLLNDQDYERFRHELDVVPWLGFDHDITQDYPPVLIQQYPILRGWTPEQIDSQRLDRTPLSDPNTLAMF